MDYNGQMIKQLKICVICGDEFFTRKENKLNCNKQSCSHAYNKTKRLQQKKEYYLLNKEEILKRNKQHRKKTLTARNLYCKQYRLKNKEKELARNREYYNNKANTDMDYKLNRTLRARINMAIKLQYGIKSIKSIELLGADIDTVRQYLESKFQKGMSWENHGTYGWHIDHVKPCDAFDLTDPNQQKECFNYKNLQPLWAEENLKKGKKC